MAPKRLRYDPANDYYTILGVSPRASAEDIHLAFRKRAKSVHPDLNPERSQWAHEQFQHLTAAHDILGDPDSRAAYDELRRRHLLPTVSAKPIRNVSLAEASRAAWAHRSRRRHLSLPYQLSLMMLFTGGLLYLLRGLPDYEQYQREIAASTAYFAPPVSAATSLPIYAAGSSKARNFIAATLPAWEGPSSSTPASETSCDSPNETIIEPRNGDVVQIPFRIVGTASGNDFVSYRLSIIDETLLLSDPGNRMDWTALGTQMQSPVSNDLLIPENQTGALSGQGHILVLRLSMNTSDGKTMPPCEVTFRLAASDTF